MNLSTSKIRSKITKNAELIGGAIGWFSEPCTSSIELTIEELQALFRDPKHLDAAIDAVTWRATELAKQLVVPYVAVELSKGLGLPLISKNAGAIQKAIMGYASGFLLAAFIGNLTGRHEESFTGRTERNIVNKALAPNYEY